MIIPNTKFGENFEKFVEFEVSDTKYLDISKAKGLRDLKLASVPLNVMIAVILMGFLSFKVPPEAEIRLFKNRLFAIPDTKL